MADGSYVLGVDGLPLGTAAAVAAGGALQTTFALTGAGARGGGVSQRVRAAVARAEADLGSAPAEVRLVCIDDGGDGDEITLTAEWLASRGIAFRVLDLGGSDDTLAPATADPDAQQARSAARASEAALW